MLMYGASSPWKYLLFSEIRLSQGVSVISVLWVFTGRIWNKKADRFLFTETVNSKGGKKTFFKSFIYYDKFTILKTERGVL